MDIRFITSNKFKAEEAKEILANADINVIRIEKDIEELQTKNTHNLVKDKVLKAFNDIRRPLFVEHTGLYLEYLNGFPGGLTQIFWDTLKEDKFSKIFGNTENNKASAKTVIGFCDGYEIYFFEGKIKGKISNIPKGNTDFQWDCVFIPEGYNKTFSELGDQKNEISMRRQALDKFSDFLIEKRD